MSNWLLRLFGLIGALIIIMVGISIIINVFEENNVVIMLSVIFIAFVVLICLKIKAFNKSFLTPKSSNNVVQSK